MTSLEELDYVLEELFATTTLEEARTIINDGAGKLLSEMVRGGWKPAPI